VTGERCERSQFVLVTTSFLERAVTFRVVFHMYKAGALRVDYGSADGARRFNSLALFVGCIASPPDTRQNFRGSSTYCTDTTTKAADMGSGYSNEKLDGEARLIGQKLKDAELGLDDLPPLDNEAAWFVLEVELHLTTFQYTMLRDLKEFRGASLCRTVGLVLVTVTTCSSWPSQIIDNLPPEAVAVTHSSLQRTHPRPLLM
jgi:hypothetical protein